MSDKPGKTTISLSFPIISKPTIFAYVQIDPVSIPSSQAVLQPCATLSKKPAQQFCLEPFPPRCSELSNIETLMFFLGFLIIIN